MARIPPSSLIRPDFPIASNSNASPGAVELLQLPAPHIDNPAAASDFLPIDRRIHELWRHFTEGRLPTEPSEAQELIATCARLGETAALSWLMAHAAFREMPWAGHMVVADMPDAAFETLCDWMREPANAGLVNRLDCRTNAPDRLAALMDSARAQPIVDLAIACDQLQDGAAESVAALLVGEHGVTHLAIRGDFSTEGWRVLGRALPDCRLISLRLHWHSNDSCPPRILSIQLPKSGVEVLDIRAHVDSAGIQHLCALISNPDSKVHSLTLGVRCDVIGPESRLLLTSFAKTKRLRHLSLEGCRGKLFNTIKHWDESGLQLACTTLASYEPPKSGLWNAFFRKGIEESRRRKLLAARDTLIVSVRSSLPTALAVRFEGFSPLHPTSRAPWIPPELAQRILEEIDALATARGSPRILTNFLRASLPIDHDNAWLRAIDGHSSADVEGHANGDSATDSTDEDEPEPTIVDSLFEMAEKCVIS